MQQQRSCVDAAADALLQRLQERNRRGEAKAWLVSTLAAAGDAGTAAARLACFLPYDDTAGSSSSSPVASCKAAQLAILVLLVDAQPGAVSALLLRDSEWLAAFLTASPARISAWFGHFDAGGMHRFGFGARALANYALAQRSSVWHHLVWHGKHSQSPVAVAARPHYFGELDVPATISNLARHCPRFWSSDELQRSCQGGEWLALDRDAVSKELRRLLLDSHSSRRRPLQQQLEVLVLTADWALLCQRLLPLLPEGGLLQVARALSSAQQQQPLPAAAGRHHGSSSSHKKLSRRGGGGGGSLQHWLAAQAAYEEAQQGAEPAPAAAALPCAADLSPLLLQGLSGVSSSSSSQSSSSSSSKEAWSLDELLLANALLTTHRSQLLLLLWPEAEEQDDDAAAVVTAAAEAVWKAWLDGSLTTPAAAAHSQQPGSHQQPLLPSKLRPLRYPQHLLRLLLVAWLLRLQLLLQLAAHAEAAAGGHHDVQQQLQLPQGWTCRLLPPQKPAEQQQRQPAPGEGPKSALKRGASRSPRRRSSNSSSSDRGGDSDSSSRRRRRSKHKHRRSSGKQHKNKKQRRARDSQDDGSDSSGGRRSRRKRRRRAGSDSDEGEEDSGRRQSGWESIDFDAGGALLDPADFAGAAGGGRGGGGSAAGAALQQGQRSGVAATLASLRAGGALWRSPAWAACVPAASGGGAVVRFQGTTAEVADALACVLLHSVLAAAVHA